MFAEKILNVLDDKLLIRNVSTGSPMCLIKAADAAVECNSSFNFFKLISNKKSATLILITMNENFQLNFWNLTHLYKLKKFTLDNNELNELVNNSCSPSSSSSATESTATSNNCMMESSRNDCSLVAHNESSMLIESNNQQQHDHTSEVEKQEEESEDPTIIKTKLIPLDLNPRLIDCRLNQNDPKSIYHVDNHLRPRKEMIPVDYGISNCKPSLSTVAVDPKLANTTSSTNNGSESQTPPVLPSSITSILFASNLLGSNSCNLTQFDPMIKKSVQQKPCDPRLSKTVAAAAAAVAKNDDDDDVEVDEIEMDGDENGENKEPNSSKLNPIERMKLFQKSLERKPKNVVERFTAENRSALKRTKRPLESETAPLRCHYMDYSEVDKHKQQSEAKKAMKVVDKWQPNTRLERVIRVRNMRVATSIQKSLSDANEAKKKKSTFIIQSVLALMNYDFCNRASHRALIDESEAERIGERRERRKQRHDINRKIKKGRWDEQLTKKQDKLFESLISSDLIKGDEIVDDNEKEIELNIYDDLNNDDLISA